MLDRSGANNRIVFRWLGGFAAEPVWDKDLVGFYVRDDKGGRLEDVIVQSASAQDLQGQLRDDLAKLRQRLEKSKGETPTERTLRKILMRSFQDLVDNPGRNDLDSYFFRYRDVLGNWRLIWCWGYERLDHEPAPAVICTDPDCNLLFVRRPGKSPRCPSCEGVLAPRKKRKTKRNLALLALLLLLLLGGVGWWLWSRPALIVTPGEFAGTAGTRIDCHVMTNGLFSKKDVTHEVVGITIDPQVARFDQATGQVRLKAAGDTRIDFHYGRHKVEALVKSAPSPDPDKLVSVDLTPAGPINLPLGQMVRLQAFANYGDGRRVGIPSERIKWISEEKSSPGLELYSDQEVVGAVGAIKAGAGPLNVYADYQGQESNHVAFRSVAADPNVKLDIDVDRTLRIAGEGGRVVLTASSPSGDVELVPSLTSFKSSSEKVLKVADKTGKFATGTPGVATVTGIHPAATDPAKKEFHVSEPAKARLVFHPDNARVAVNEKTSLELILEAERDEGGKKIVEGAPMQGQGVSYFVAQPQAARYYPPTLTGLSPASPFEISASVPVIVGEGKAKVEVVAAQPKALRITPSSASPLAAGQPVALTVEQQAGESDLWQEVRPDAVKWTVPSDLVWTPPTETLRPSVTLLPDLKGEVKLEASLGDKTASMAFTLKESGPDAKDPAARLVVDREPGGKLLALGQSQRYTVMVEKDGHREPAADVHWPENFENDYVKWEAPILTAKQQEGYTQFLRADVAGRNVLWHTTTYRPGDYTPKDRPDLVKIFGQQGLQQVQNVRFPVGATFTDFKVEVHYPDGYTRFVTKKAILTTKEPAASAPVTTEHGKFVGVRPGSTEVTAEFQGVKSQVALTVDVTADVEVDKIAIEPGIVPMRPGETYDLHVIGYKDGKSVGDITGLGNLNWKSSNPEVARLSGAAIIASNLGESEITVERKGLASPPAKVTVSNRIPGDLRVEPQVIQMVEGESQQFGDAIHVLRGDLDVSQQAMAVPESPGVVQFDPATHTLRAIRVGEVPLGITMGDKMVQARVIVRPQVLAGRLVVEPGAVILAPGQAERLVASIETPNGDKVAVTATVKAPPDQTIVGFDPAIGRVRALQPGKTEVTVEVSGMKPVTVPVEVTKEEITELSADPVSLDMAVGDHRHLRFFGKAQTSGQKEMFPQSELKVAPQTPNTVDVIGGEDVQAKAVGADTIDAAWRGKLKVSVPVKVAANTISGLQITPTPQTVHVGQAVTYAVSGIRDGNRVILTPADGLQVNVADPAVAKVASEATVVATGLGQTKVVAEFGGQKVDADLYVTPSGPGVDTIVGGPQVVTGGVIYGSDGRQVVIGGGTTVIPAGKVVGLSFEPQRYMAAVQALPQTAKLHRVYANGGFDDVSNDSRVQITSPPNAEIARLEKVDGGWKINHVGPGHTKMSATLDGQTADMDIDIMGEPVVVGAPKPPAGELIVDPRSVLDLWSGETRPITGVIDPGAGQPPIPVEVSVKAPDSQGIVAVEGNKVTGRSVGDVAVTVSTAGGQTAAVNVHVSAGDSVYFNPPSYNLQAGDPATPAIMAKSADGTEVAVAAPIESLDKNVMDVNPAQPGQFIARSQGQTQFRAAYRGKEVFAQVSVSGKRFETVKPEHNPIDKDTFEMTIEVLAAAGEGDLEYRVYNANDPSPKDNWVPNAADGDKRKVILRSDRIRYDSGEQYNLVIEARDKKTNSVQKYPLTLVRSITVQQRQSPGAAPPPDSPKPNGSK
jgi:hypothetical protein